MHKLIKLCTVVTQFFNHLLTWPPDFYFFHKVLTSLLHPCRNTQERVLPSFHLQLCSDHGPWILLLLESSVLIPHHQINTQEGRCLNLVLLQPITLWHSSLTFTSSRKFWPYHPIPSETPRGEDLFQVFKKPYSEPQHWLLLLPESLSLSSSSPITWWGFLRFFY